MGRSHKLQPGVVLAFVRQRHSSMREKIGGIYAAAIACGWQVLPVDEQISPERLRELVALWHPIGCIVDTSAMPGNPPASAILPMSWLRRLPTVIIGRDLRRSRQVLDCSVQEVRAPVLEAVRKFRDHGLEHFAYVGDPGRYGWSIERGRLFAAAVRSWTFDRYGGADPGTASGCAELAKWLEGLRKPVGVLLAADHLAMPFYSAARRARLEIGRDLVVIGIDNDVNICESLAPTLSSVGVNFHQAGANAVELLQRRIDAPELPPQRQTYGIFGFVARASTARQMADKRLGQGFLFIEEHAGEHIASKDVANAMDCGRRMAEKMFRSVLKQTILDTIRQKRLEMAKDLLTNTQYPIDAIPPMCGYDSLPHMKTYFKQQTGMTMREWRNKSIRKQA